MCGMTELYILYIPCPNADAAEEIARILLEERLVACANILPAMQSLYHWEGEIVQESEVLLLLKTQATQLEAVERRVSDLHPYDIPCITAWTCSANAAFARWVTTESRGMVT